MQVMKTQVIRDFPGGTALRLSTPNAWGPGSIPGWGTKIPYATWQGLEKTQKAKMQNHMRFPGTETQWKGPVGTVQRRLFWLTSKELLFSH